MLLLAVISGRYTSDNGVYEKLQHYDCQLTRSVCLLHLGMVVLYNIDGVIKALSGGKGSISLSTKMAENVITSEQRRNCQGIKRYSEL